MLRVLPSGESSACVIEQEHKPFLWRRFAGNVANTGQFLALWISFIPVVATLRLVPAKARPRDKAVLNFVAVQRSDRGAWPTRHLPSDALNERE
jgi:hypothetical protein